MMLLRRNPNTRTASPADQAGLAVAVGPAAVENTPRYVKVGDGYAATLIVTGYPAEVGAAWLDPLLQWPGRLDVVVYIDPLAPQLAAARLRRQRARLESNRRTDAEKGRLADPATEAAADDAAELADRIARGHAKLFRVGLYLCVHAPTLPELDEAVAHVRATAASVLLDTQPATWRQPGGLAAIQMSVLNSTGRPHPALSPARWPSPGPASQATPRWAAVYVGCLLGFGAAAPTPNTGLTTVRDLLGRGLISAGRGAGCAWSSDRRGRPRQHSQDGGKCGQHRTGRQRPVGGTVKGVRSAAEQRRDHRL